MPYKDKDKSREAAAERQRKHREGVTQEGVTGQGVTLGVTQYPAILRALVDPEKRTKLEKIYQSLSNFKQAENVYYGCIDPVPFDVVGELLEVTK